MRIHFLVQSGKLRTILGSGSLADCRVIKLDYTCGIMPVTHVDRVLDALPASFNFKKLNGIAKGAYTHYDAVKMEGLPVGVQVVGQRLEEEKVLAVMERIEDALEKNGQKYHLLEVE